MKRLAAAVALLISATALAARPPEPVRSAQPAASAQPAGSAQPADAPPPGDLPPGHPPVDEQRDAPHGRPGMEGPPDDDVDVDPALPPGTIAITIADAGGVGLAGAPVDLDIDKNSVAQGESHDSISATADERGQTRIGGQLIGSTITYKVHTKRDGAEFASVAFRLDEKHGMRVTLHAYESTRVLADAMFLMEAWTLLDVKQDTIRVTHVLHTYNIGHKAFVAQDVSMALPAGWRAFNQERSSGEMAMAERDGQMELTGTFPPGQAELVYAYTLPLEPAANIRLKLPLPPRVAAAQVSVSAATGMDLVVAGFPKAELTKRRDGVRVLQAVKQIDPRRDPMAFLANVAPGELDVTVRGLPTGGWGPKIAVLLAVLAVALGATQLLTPAAGSGEMARELCDARDALLDELVVLERAHKSGEVGPKSYERLRIALLDALSRIMTRLDAASKGAA